MELPVAAEKPQLAEEQPLPENVQGLVLLGFLGFKLLHVSSGRIEGTFTVGAKSTQPSNVLNGGISAFFAETLASMGGQVASGWQQVAGIELNINHLRAVPAGTEVTVVATPLSVGNRVQVWEVRFQVQPGSRLVAISRVTLIVGLPGAAAVSTHATKLLKSFNSKL